MKLQEFEDLGDKLITALLPWMLVGMMLFVSLSAVIGLTIALTKGCN